jgi:hypothetical protein
LSLADGREEIDDPGGEAPIVTGEVPTLLGIDADRAVE